MTVWLIGYLFRRGDRCNSIIFYQNVQNIRERNRWKRRAKTDVLIPRCRRVNRMQTAFCSYHDRMKEKRSSFTEHPNASASVTGPGSHHRHHYTGPRSISRGRPLISPRSRSLKRNFPQARVRTILSEGVCFTNSV